jgi:hypothetical protein
MTPLAIAASPGEAQWLRQTTRRRNQLVEFTMRCTPALNHLLTASLTLNTPGYRLAEYPIVLWGFDEFLLQTHRARKYG